MAVSAPSVASAASFSERLSSGCTSTRKALGSGGFCPLSLGVLVVAMVYPFKSEFMLLYAVHSCMPMAQRCP